VSQATLNGSAADLQERLRDPATAKALDHLLEHASDLARIADAAALVSAQLPGGLAMFVDSADEIADRLTANGVDIGKGIANGAEAALRFGAIMGPDEVASIAALLESGVLDAKAVQLVGRLGAALATTASAAPSPVGLIGAMRALRDPDVQRALGFLLAFAKQFGHSLGAATAAH
jgi:uncharacterized protein YjgD (DUF1641 family)